MKIISDRYLFSGDAFKVSNGNVGFHQLTMDKEVARESIEKIREILSANNYLVLTSHYGYYEKVNINKKKTN